MFVIPNLGISKLRLASSNYASIHKLERGKRGTNGKVCYSAVCLICIMSCFLLANEKLDILHVFFGGNISVSDAILSTTIRNFLPRFVLVFIVICHYND